MNHSMMRSLRILFLVASCSLLLGCGNGRKEVSGTVNLDGQPLPSGNIMFFALDGTEGGQTGGEIENGVYTIDSEMGLVPGRYRVEIQAYRTSEVNEAEPGEEPFYPSEPYLPARYNTESELTIEFTGDDLAPFDLKSDSSE